MEDEWDRLNEEERQLREELERLRDDTSAIKSQLDMHSSERLPALRNLVDERMAGELQTELTRIKGDVEAAGHLEEDLLEEERHLQEELAETEGRLQGIRAQMESLTNEIKQANLQSLSIAPADDLKVLLEGTHKSPRLFSSLLFPSPVIITVRSRPPVSQLLLSYHLVFHVHNVISIWWPSFRPAFCCCSLRYSSSLMTPVPAFPVLKPLPNDVRERRKRDIVILNQFV